MVAATPSRNEFKLGWKVLLAGILGVAFGASPLPFNIIGFTVGPLTEEFGWTKTQIMAPITIFGLVASLLAPYFGHLADKYGVRRVALLSVFGFAVTFAAISLTTPSLFVYYALWLVVGLVGIGSTPITWSRAINLWFFKNRGLALGILLLGTSLPPFFIPHIAVWASETWGWRSMFIVTACFPLFIALPFAYFFFREPRPEEQPVEIQSSSGELTGVTLGEALRDYRFWLIWLSVVFIALTFGGAYVNMAPLLADKGISSAVAASAMSAFGLGIFSGRIVTGLLLDRFWAGFVGFPILCLPAISSVLLLQDNLAVTAAITAGLFLGLAAGAESDLIAYLTGRYFGMAHYGKIYGMLYMPFGICSAASPLIYALIRDTTGSYEPALTIAIGTYIVGGGLLLFLGKYPREFGNTSKQEAQPAPAAAET